MLVWLIASLLSGVVAQHINSDGRSWDGTRTTFSYKSNDIYEQVTIAIENCPQFITYAGTRSPTSGLNHATGLSGMTFTGLHFNWALPFDGHVAEKTLKYVALKNGVKYEGEVTGPDCRHYQDVACVAKTSPTDATCAEGQGRITAILDGMSSSNVVSYQWAEHSSLDVQMLNADNGMASVMITPSMTNVVCAAEITVSLTVTGDDPLDVKTCTAKLKVSDTVQPHLHGIVPGNDQLTVESYDIPSLPVLTATDNCDVDVTIERSEVKITDGYDKCGYKLVRSWRAIDDCANEDTYVQEIVVVDTTPPELNGVEEDLTVECVAIPPPCIVEGIDYNGVTVHFTEQTIDEKCDCHYKLVRTWTAVDCAGNSVTKDQTISVIDETPPVITGVPVDHTYPCDAVPEAPVLTAKDACCSSKLTYHQEKLDGTCEDEYTLYRVWTASDDCDNSVQAVQTIEVVDDEAPQLIGGEPDETVICDEKPRPCIVECDDNCDNFCEITQEEETYAGTCDDAYSHIYTWTALDTCGNSNSLDQTVTVIDDEPPVFIGLPPSALTVECDSVPHFELKAKDNCAESVVVRSDEVKIVGEDLVYNYVAVLSWSATDACGNTVEHDLTLTVQDSQQPALIGVPSDTTTDCDSIPDVAEVEATDNCCPDYLLEATVVTTRKDGSCPNNYEIVHVWTAEDCEGNVPISGSQTIAVEDKTAPVLSALPNSVTVECSGVPEIAVLTATDNCDADVPVETTESTEDGNCKLEYTIIRTFTATDDCGNVYAHVQTIEVQDTVPPVFTDIPEDVTVECELAEPGEPTVTDECDLFISTVVTTPTEESGTCEYEKNIVRHFKACDSCGLCVEAEQSVTIQDTIPPYFVDFPDAYGEDFDAVYEYGEEAVLPTPEGADNCDPRPSIHLTEVKVNDTTPCAVHSWVTIRTWTITDRCGNSGSDVDQVVLTVDYTPCVWQNSLPGDAEYECSGIMAPATLECDDDGIMVDVDYSETKTPGECQFEYVIHRKWTAEDECGNIRTHEQDVSVVDTTPPVITGVPADDTIECTDDEVAEPNVTAWDNCDGDLTPIRSSHTVEGDCEPDFKTIYRDWTVTDSCGHLTTESQTITVKDAYGPIYTVFPEDKTIECHEAADYETIEAAVAIDRCETGNLVVQAQPDQEDGTCDDSWLILNEYVVVDYCGHEKKDTQTITVHDTQAPQISEVDPKFVTTECDSTYVPPELTATDNCDDVTVSEESHKVPVLGSCKEHHVIYWKWHATDRCGNTASTSLTVEIMDTIPPTIFCGDVACPPSETFHVECDDLIVETPSIITAVDNCAEDPRVEMTEVKTEGTCDHSYTLTRTWVAEDDCGLQDTHVQVIHVQDTYSPEFSEYSLPEEEIWLNYGDDDTCPEVVIEGDDNCYENPSVSCSEVTYPEYGDACSANYRKVCTCNIVDDCGNVGRPYQQIINVASSWYPVISAEGMDDIIECESELPEPPVEPTVQWPFAPNTGHLSHTKREESPSNTDCEKWVIYTWVATDDCNMTATAESTIKIRDTTAPVITYPDDVDVDCNDLWVYPTPTVSDNCMDPYVVDSCTEKVKEGVEDACERIICTATATDDCGNQASAVHTIRIHDDDPPTIVGTPPTSEVFDNCVHPPVIPVVFHDECDLVTTDTYTSEVVEGSCDCNWEETRTYTATDKCGNTNSYEYTIKGEDTVAPTLQSCPDDITVDAANVPDQMEVIGLDEDGNPTVVTSNVTTIDDEGVITNEVVYLILYQWITCDPCGNCDPCDQTITVEEVTPPEVSGVPTDVTIPCPMFEDEQIVYENEWTTEYIETQVTNSLPPGCTAEMNVDEITNGTCANIWSWKRCWEVTCLPAGATSSQCFTVAFTDDSNPVFEEPLPVSGTVTVECAPPPPEELSASDCYKDCLPTVTLNEVETGKDTNNWKIVRTWLAVDCCGNEMSRTQTVQVFDTLPPSFDTATPATVTAECDNVPEPTPLTANDVCHDVTVVCTDGLETGDCPNNYIATYTCVATDEVGNHATSVQYTNVVDTTPPVLMVGLIDSYASAAEALANGVKIGDSPAAVDVTYECDDTGPIPEVFWVDGCEPNFHSVSPKYAHVSHNDQDCEDLYSVTWTATDLCGNTMNHVMTITQRISEGPEFQNFPEDVDDVCPEDAIIVPPTVHHNCTGGHVPTKEETKIPGTCDHEYQRVITFHAEDYCGHTISDDVTVTVHDAGAPTLTLHADPVKTLQCPEVDPQPSATWSDPCDETGEVKFTEEREDGSCPYEYKLIRAWTSSNDCGATAEVTQTVNIVDEIPPVFITDYSHDITNECDPGVYHQPDGAATDTCSDGHVTVTSTQTPVAGTCDNEYQLIETWVAEDECGNSVSMTRTVSVVDTAQPDFTLAAYINDQTIECNEEHPMPAVSASDVCDETPVVTPVETREDGTCEDEYFLHRTWTAVDVCGNIKTLEQKITVEDSQPPTVTVIPEKETYECDELPTEDNFDVHATDNCDQMVTVDWSSHEDGTECSDTWVYKLEWTVSDDCGNVKVYNLDVGVDDTTPPKLDKAPDAVEYTCQAEPHVDLGATDNCDPNPMVEYSETSSGECPTTIWRTWTATDKCGNEDTESQKVVIVDDGPPVLVNVPLSVTQECTYTPPSYTVTATDECDAVPVTMTNQTFPGHCEHEKVVINTWTATDSCGQTTTATQTVTVVDTVDPLILDVPEDLTVDCDDFPGVPVITTEDNCDSRSLTATEDFRTIPGTCTNEYKVVRKWILKDSCNNDVRDEYTVTVVDVTKPVMVFEPPLVDQKVKCDDGYVVTDPTYTDNCGGEVEYSHTKTRRDGTCVYDYDEIHVFTATDVCGNVDTATATVEVYDDSEPIFGELPEDSVEYSCDDVPGPAYVTATDPCGGTPTVDYTDDTVYGTCDYEYTVYRTWVATDECGLENVFTQTVSVIDDTLPVIEPHDSVTVEIGNVPMPWTCKYTDNCDENGEKEYEEIKNPDTCEHKYSLTYKCCHEDCAGNVGCDEYVVYVQDTTPPIIDGVPQDDTYEYQDIPPEDSILDGVIAIDDSSENLHVKYESITIPGLSENDYVIYRKFWVMDDCGNYEEEWQTIVIIDETPPCLDEFPEDETAECDQVPAPCPVYVVGEDISVEHWKYDGDGFTIYSWKATDPSGNTVSHHQTITIEDTTPPVLTRYPESETIECECEGLPPKPAVVAIDNCDEEPVMDETESKEEGTCEDAYIIRRSWVATDNMGNAVEWHQSITVQDTVAPEFMTALPDLTIDCMMNLPDPTKVVVNDDCDEDVEVTYPTPVVDEGPCFNSEQTLEWRAVDNCGNEAIETQKWTVVDNNPPVVTTHDVCFLSGSLATLDIDGLFQTSDLCSGPVARVGGLSCNSTAIPATACNAFLNDGVMTMSGVELDQTYTLEATYADNCGEQTTASVDIWVPVDAEAAAIRGMSCL